MFDQLSSECDIDEYIDFNTEVVTFLPAIDPLMVYWRQETRNNVIAEVMETSDAAADEANQSKGKPEILTDEYENRKIIVAKALKKLDEVKNKLKMWSKRSSEIKNKKMLEVSLDLEIINMITRSLNIIFVDKKYDVIILPYCIFDFTC